MAVEEEIRPPSDLDRIMLSPCCGRALWGYGPALPVPFAACAGCARVYDMNVLTDLPHAPGPLLGTVKSEIRKARGLDD